MAKFAFLVELTAIPGKESELEIFLNKEAKLVRAEPGTLSWHAAKDEADAKSFVIFDTFENEAGREAHLNGEAGKQLAARWQEYLSAAPKIHRLQIVAAK